jgi:hypothetical protein
VALTEAQKASCLVVFGQELGRLILSNAEEAEAKTKELEQLGIDYKMLKTEARQLLGLVVEGDEGPDYDEYTPSLSRWARNELEGLAYRANKALAGRPKSIADRIFRPVADERIEPSLAGAFFDRPPEMTALAAAYGEKRARSQRAALAKVLHGD